ncbi:MULTISPECIES: acyl-CoA thioesterase [Chryseobacterium]|uniref:Acyl-CoA thioester hydrolase n=1 Tax=Chryseobacterium geocarposphaerae TaxID=1416776 RepID=A0A2M9C369_9FLAO|nr:MULTISPECIES: acyl-CoA thioesterase [Chryseobacterium]MPS63467.1 acyl-CoA thioesterase [Chryseobacterium sp.]PJJ64875.1 acyl-CoA thioester hydrolase [Chryseobacterium geocarposphaerae]UMQ41055.1 acyl-CoA thioesterase [Chryseobacterium sp. Y16C]
MGKEVSKTVKIRFIDCDPLGHLNNVRYLDYMLNAREDHVEEFYGFTYEEYTKKTGCTWVTIQNEIAYLKEVKYNTVVVITSKTIEIQDRTSKVELLMKSEDGKTIYAVFWLSVIYFNVKTRRSEVQPKELVDMFSKYHVDLEQKDFQSRVKFLRSQNAKNS